MKADDDIRYRAVQSRDARFDGKFFTGVATTGIYCRPICSAKTPKRDNVRFFSCAAAAEAAGYRPCKRCRPETAPGTPVWNGTASSVSRGLRLINAGFLDERSLEELAATLGLGSRHLRRLFVQHLGTAPKTLDIIRKTHFAATLLSQTALPAGTIAFEAGFGSIRQFNDAFKCSFGLSPIQFRSRLLEQAPVAGGARPITLKLAYRPPFDWGMLSDFFGHRALRGVESVSPRAYRRSFAVPSSAEPSSGFVEVTPHPKNNELTVTISAPIVKRPLRLSTIATRVRRMFDLLADPEVIAEQLASEPLLGPLVEARPGVRIAGVWTPFEAAVRAILGQQITVETAVDLVGQLVQLCRSQTEDDANTPGDSASIAASPVRTVFPTPQQVYDADLSALHVPEGRKRSLKAIATAWLDGRFSRQCPGALEELIEELQAIEGVGPWTAEYTALRGFGEPDAFPYPDIGLRKAVGKLLGLSRYASPREVSELAERWRPWRGYAAMLLWESLASNATEGK